MASTHKSLRSGTANKRPTTSIADGQIALNTNTTSPGLFFKDSTGATIIKVGPVHVGTTAPNASPAAGGSSGNSTGEVWLDTSLTPNGVKIWNGASWTNATPIGSTTVQGLLELATNAETQTGTDPDRAVTPAGLQSKVSDSTSTTSSTTIASSTAVKSAYDLANAALPKSGGTVTGNLEIGTTGSLSFEGATADAFETTIAVVDPTADRTITLPDTTGTVVTTGDTGTVTSTMIADGTIVDADISATAEIAVSKLADGTARQLLQTDAAGTGVEWASNIDIPGTLDVTSTATFDSIASHPLGSAAAPTLTFTGDTNTGIYSPGADQVAISTNGQGRLFIGTTGAVGINNSSPSVLFHVTGTTGYVLAADGTTSGTTLGVFSDASYTKLIAVNNARSSFAPLVLDGSDTRFLVSGTERLRITSTGALNFVGAGTAGSTQAVSFNGSAPVNSLVIDSSGRLGVGTSSPVLPLTVAGAIAVGGAGNNGIQFYNASPTATALRWLIANNQGDSDKLSIYRYDSSGNFAGTPLVIDSSNRVGIGTSSPAQRLHVSGSNAGGFQVTNADNSDAISLFVRGGNPINSTTDNAVLHVGQRSDVSIITTGRVGIGNTAPGNFVGNVNLVVGSAATSTTNAGVTLYSGTATYGGVYFADGTVGDQLYRGAVEYKHDQDALAFYSSGGEKARIDSSGRLLLGTSSSISNVYVGGAAYQSPFQVIGNAAGYGNGLTSLNYSAGGYGATLTLGSSKNATVGVNGAVANADDLGIINFVGNDGTNFRTGAYIIATVDGTTGTADLPTRLAFWTAPDGTAAPVERMRISNSGDVNCGPSSSYTSAVRLRVTAKDQSSSNYCVDFLDSATNVLFYVRNDGWTNTGVRTYSPYNNTTALAANTTLDSSGNLLRSTSSIRFKKDVETLQDRYADNILQARPVWYKSIAEVDSINADWGYWGFIAEEVAEVDPRLVFWKTHETMRDEDGKETSVKLEKPLAEGVQYDRFVPHLLNLIKRQKEQIEAMEARLTALESA